MFMKRVPFLFCLITIIFVFISCSSTQWKHSMTVYYPYPYIPYDTTWETCCFRINLPTTDNYSFHDVEGDRCYIFYYPSMNNKDTALVYISHSGFENCDCSYFLVLNKVKYSYNDSIFNVRFAGAPDDENIRYKFLMLNKQKDTITSEFRYKEFAYDTMSIIYQQQYFKTLDFLGTVGIPQLKDTTILSGIDNNKLLWKDVKIKKKITIGYLNVRKSKQKTFEKILESLELINKSSIDTSINDIIL